MSSSALIGAIGAIRAAAAGATPRAIAAAGALPRALATVTASTTSFKLPDMPYDYGALEPFISGEIMRVHHTKHHDAYVTNLNASLDKYAKAEAAGNVSEMIALQGAIRFNGGGHVNHSIFWANLAPAGARTGTVGVAAGGCEPRRRAHRMASRRNAAPRPARRQGRWRHAGG
jgi:hypothetical protein